jgi:spore coat polysaccharide biosynthesis protein SpsF
LSSSRLPAKALLPVAGMPSVVLSAKRAGNTGADVVVATSTDFSDDPLVKTLVSAGIPYIRGPLDDVLGRFELAACDLLPSSIVVRLTADNIFPDGEFIEEIVRVLMSKNLKYLGTYSPIDNLPYGLSAEAFTVEVLREASAEATSEYDREHVTPWIKRKFGLEIFKPGKLTDDLSHLRCTLDTFDDYLRLTKLFSDIRDPVEVPWYVLCDKLSKDPDEPKSRIPYIMKNEIIHSKLTLGTAQLGMNYGVANISGQPSKNEAVSIIRQAIIHGVTSIDCARAYGDAEKRVGEALVGGYADRVNVVTKLDPFINMDSYELKENVRLAVDASIFRSCRELHTQKLQTLLLHRWAHRFACKEVIWQRLLELKEEGVLNVLGVSVQTPQEMIEAFQDPDIGHIQFPFNILDWRWKDAGVDQVAQKRSDVVVHARSALLQGVLSADPSAWPSIETINAADWVRRIDELVKELGRESRADLCFAYVRAQPWITSIVVGMDNISQLHENIKLFQKPPLTYKECLIVENSLLGAPEELLNPSKWKKK